MAQQREMSFRVTISRGPLVSLFGGFKHHFFFAICELPFMGGDVLSRNTGSPD